MRKNCEGFGNATTRAAIRNLLEIFISEDTRCFKEQDSFQRAIVVSSLLLIPRDGTKISLT
jgi:hypothetical protein